jgi:hypothetical protein
MKLYYGTDVPLQRFYTLGGGGAVNILLPDAKKRPQQAVMYALGHLPGRSARMSGRSGVQLVTAGDFAKARDTAPGATRFAAKRHEIKSPRWGQRHQRTWG